MKDRLHKAFFEYASNYDLNDSHIGLKLKHMQRVEKISRFLASKIGLEDELIELAGAIGLLHDIGRFYQIKHFGTFSDSDSIDHAEASNIVLFDEGNLEKFIGKKMAVSYGEVIKKAIYYHNKIYLPKDTSNFSYEELTLAKLIRDADKIDIFRGFLVSGFAVAFQLKGGMDPAAITPEVEESFYKKELIDYSLRNSYVDEYISKLAYVFDFNFKESKLLLARTRYLERITDALFNQVDIKSEETKGRINKILEFAMDHLSKG